MSTLIAPCAGLSSRYGAGKPKYLYTSPCGKPIFFLALEPLLNLHEKVIFIILKDHDNKYNASTIIKQCFQEYGYKEPEILILKEVLNGPAFTVNFAVEEAAIKGSISIKDCDSICEADNYPIGENAVSYIDASKNDIDRLSSKSSLEVDEHNKIIIIAVPADRSPLLRMKGANRCTAIAEYFRSKGKNVLLIMDSLTRVAHAKREIGLALGEQPTSKGYPPSVISMIPSLIERTGNGIKNEGSVTAFYTVLADSDDHNDPVVDSARAILDGHIILSREQSQLGIYPAIDIKNSISRIMDDIVGEEQKNLAKHFKKLVSVYQESRDLVLMGGYTKGQDAAIDEAHDIWPKLVDFIKQDQDDKSNYDDSIKDLKSLITLKE